MTGPARVRAVSLLVIYTERLEACRAFYAGLGLPLVQEQHGSGPMHYAAELDDGIVIELYPGRPDRSTGRLRLGLTASGGDRDPGEHVLSDPDGRRVVLTVKRDERCDHERSLTHGPEC